MVLYWCDGLKVIEQLFSNPTFTNSIEYDAYELINNSTNYHVYGDFMSAQFTWQYQVNIYYYYFVLMLIHLHSQTCMPKGGTMLGVIGASDKTPLTIGTNNHEMDPVLLSLANIEPGVHMKVTSYSFILATYLSIPKFINVTTPVQAALTACVFHTSITILTEHLQCTSQEGVCLIDPTWSSSHMLHPAHFIDFRPP